MNDRKTSVIKSLNTKRGQVMQNFLRM